MSFRLLNIFVNVRVLNITQNCKIANVQQLPFILRFGVPPLGGGTEATGRCPDAFVATLAPAFASAL